MFLEIIYSVCFLALVIGTYTDFKTREVPDWLNFSLIASGLGIRLIYSATEMNWSYIINGLYGFGVFLVLAMIMFYTGQWGGGDSKMLMGLGALIGLEISLDSFLVGFVINVLIIGAVYGLLYSLYLTIRNWKKFVNAFGKIFSKKPYSLIRKIVLILCVILLGSMIFIEETSLRLTMFSLAVILFLSYYLWIHVKIIERIAMHKYVNPEELTEGDWIVNEVKVDGKYICGPKDLGVEKNQINKLIRLKRLGKIKRILIKEGIPFVPSFLTAFIVTYIYGNIIFLILMI
ncbi:prepilin peptidase [Candidatus Woesearchaeota archaeon]|nr:prepilin peptidase [Candidatus Woesearchaeota archaeon]